MKKMLSNLKRISVIFLYIIITISTIFPQTANAYLCWDDNTTRAKENADYVFIGKVISISNWENDAEELNSPRKKILFAAEEVWKGLEKEQSNLEVDTEDLYEYDFKIDEQYLVYGYKLYDGRVSLVGCPRVKLVNEAKLAVRKLGKPIFMAKTYEEKTIESEADKAIESLITEEGNEDIIDLSESENIEDILGESTDDNEEPLLEESIISEINSEIIIDLEEETSLEQSQKLIELNELNEDKDSHIEEIFEDDVIDINGPVTDDIIQLPEVVEETIDIDFKLEPDILPTELDIEIEEIEKDIIDDIPVLAIEENIVDTPAEEALIPDIADIVDELDAKEEIIIEDVIEISEEEIIEIEEVAEENIVTEPANIAAQVIEDNIIDKAIDELEFEETSEIPDVPVEIPAEPTIDATDIEEILDNDVIEPEFDDITEQVIEELDDVGNQADDVIKAMEEFTK